MRTISPATWDGPNPGEMDVLQGGSISMSTDTILVVEDSRAMQRTLQRLFESDSLQVQIASDGPTGLEFFRKQLSRTDFREVFHSFTAKDRAPTLQLQSAGTLPLRAEAGKRIVSAGRTNRSDPSNR